MPNEFHSGTIRLAARCRGLTAGIYVGSCVGDQQRLCDIPKASRMRERHNI
jgi:hypothetical protein